MKLSILTIISAVSVVAGFTPASNHMKAQTALNAEAMDRKAFLGAAALTFLAAPAVAMDQELVTDPTEQWETGSPTPAAKQARADRFKNARTQMDSNFAPIKRLTLERKSPVTRLDINSPGFTAYKKTLPGLFK